MLHKTCEFRYFKDGSDLTMKTTDKSKDRVTLYGTLILLAKTQKFYWFIGHFLSFTFFVMDTISLIFQQLVFYRYCLAAVMIAYGLVIKQVYFKNFHLKDASVVISSKDLKNRLICDDNFQYFMLAMILFLSYSIIGSVGGALYPFAIFSIFHVLAYFQGNILDSLPLHKETKRRFHTIITNFFTTYSEYALLIAANSELILILRFILISLLFPVQIFTSPSYAVVNLLLLASIVIFLKFRYLKSPYTRRIVYQVDSRINTTLKNGKLPEFLNVLYFEIKSFVRTVTDPIKLPDVKKEK